MATQKEAVIITGASRGIGLELALTLSSEYGFHVFAGVRNQKDLTNLQSQNRCETTGKGKLTPVLLDVTNPDHVQSTAEIVAQETGEYGVRGILNVAGVYKGGPLEFADIDELQRVYDVQVYGTLRMLQVFAPLLRMSESPRLILFSSPVGFIGPPFMGSNALSRGATEAMAKVLRLELLTQGVKVITIWPLGVKSGSFASVQVTNRDIEAQINTNPNWAPYQPVWQAFKRLGDSQSHASGKFLPLHVVPATAQALTAKSPKTRYVIGKGPPAILRFMPDSMFVKIFSWKFGLRKKN